MRGAAWPRAAGLLGRGLIQALPLVWLSILLPQAAAAQSELTVAAYPAVDEIIRAAIPTWRKLHPEVEIKLVSRQLTDHHTAMTAALSTAVYLPDVMALEIAYLGRFAQGGGLEDLSRPLQHRAVPPPLRCLRLCASDQPAWRGGGRAQ